MVRGAKFSVLALMFLSLYLLVGCAQPPTITGMNPTSGPSGGGTRVTITGKNFKEGVTVTIGGVPAKDISIGPKGTSVTITTPGGRPGPAEVIANNPKAKKPSLPATFTYEELKVVNTNPANASQLPWEPPITQVSVEFNQEIKAANIEIEGVMGTTSQTGSTATFTASEPLRPGQSYTVKVSNATDMADNVMADYTFSFSIEKRVVSEEELVKWYTVQEGDTLPLIAAKPEVYGDETKWVLIYQWNQDEYVAEDGKNSNDPILDPTKLVPGMTIYIPR